MSNLLPIPTRSELRSRLARITARTGDHQRLNVVDAGLQSIRLIVFCTRGAVALRRADRFDEALRGGIASRWMI
jgi:hypothetical protein